jgi:hypothetical protein
MLFGYARMFHAKPNSYRQIDMFSDCESDFFGAFTVQKQIDRNGTIKEYLRAGILWKSNL